MSADDLVPLNESDNAPLTPPASHRGENGENTEYQELDGLEGGGRWKVHYKGVMSPRVQLVNQVTGQVDYEFTEKGFSQKITCSDHTGQPLLFLKFSTFANKGKIYSSSTEQLVATCKSHGTLSPKWELNKVDSDEGFLIQFSKSQLVAYRLGTKVLEYTYKWTTAHIRASPNEKDLPLLLLVIFWLSQL